MVIIAQDGSPGRSYELNVDQLDIGRTEGTVILEGDLYVCPRHARIVRSSGQLFVQDLDSVNGIYVRIRDRVRLEEGDQILIGLHLLRVSILRPTEAVLDQAQDRGTFVFGCPPVPRYLRLTEQTMEGAPRNVYVLGREETILGREVGDIVFSTDPFMSRRHAAITRSPVDGSVWLQDVGSSNGTFLRARGRAELLAGDLMRIGQHLFRIDEDNGQAQTR